MYTETIQQQPQWGQPIQSGIPSIDSTMGMSVADDSLSIAATPATNNQKTSDRMRQDESEFYNQENNLLEFFVFFTKNYLLFF